MSADRDEKSQPDEEVHFLDAERPVAELMPIEEDERVAGEVFDLRHLLIVQAVLDGQRVEPEWTASASRSSRVGLMRSTQTYPPAALADSAAAAVQKLDTRPSSET